MNKKLEAKRLQVVASLLIGGATISSSIYPDMPIGKLNEVLDKAGMNITKKEVFKIVKINYLKLKNASEREIVAYFADMDEIEFAGAVSYLKRKVSENKLAKSRNDKLHKKTNHENKRSEKSGKKRLQIVSSLLILGVAGKAIHTNIAVEELSEDIHANITVEELNEVLDKSDMHITQEEVFEAVRRGYSNLENASDREIVAYFADIDEVEFAGHLSHIKGIAFEQELARATDGVLHEETNYEGTDLIIEGKEYSVKTGVSNQATNEDLEEGLKVIATSEIAAETEAIDGGMTIEEVTSQVSNGLVEEVLVESADFLLESSKFAIGGTIFAAVWAIGKLTGVDALEYMEKENKKNALKDKEKY